MSNGYEALRAGAAWMDLSTRGRILARGRDRARLLHNITTNEVKKMMPGAGCYAFLLSPQGRIQADLNLFCFADRFLIDTEPELREKVHQHIRRYIIADQVELEDATASTGCLAVEGPEAPALLGRLGAPLPDADFAHAEWEGRTVARVSATGQPGARVFCASPEDARELAARLEAAGAPQASAAEARTVRIENGKPRYGDDIRDISLPQETQQMHGVAFNKGCYIGQEIVERIRAQGHVNRKLMRLELEGGAPPEPGAKTTFEGNEAEITSAIVSPASGRVVALAYVRVPR
ncbi:MAG: folate-binding protein YgfZ [Acidobacteriota bacterium]|nr:folate-binding protein YgfZ [Acidobacteriota bacterium]